MIALLDSYKITHFWHFTDKSNLPQILEHGLLSLAELARRNISVPKPGGNDWSHNADKFFGVDDYVHLCFTNDHPMCHRAKDEERILEPVWLKIDKSVILDPGVRFTNDVANKSGVLLLDRDQAKLNIDFEVLFKFTDWKDPAIKARLHAARKSEVLVPRMIGRDKITV